MKGDPVKIQKREGAVPSHCNTARRIPIPTCLSAAFPSCVVKYVFPLMPKVKEELKRMEDTGIIEKVTEPTDWCSPIVVVPKATGAVRICVDLFDG